MRLYGAALFILGGLTIGAGIGLSREATAGEVVKIGTLSPKSSPWGQVFTVWEKAVKEKSGGRIELQWSSRVDHIVLNDTGVSIGAVIFSSKRLDALPADLRQIVMDTGKIAANALTKRIRSEDSAAFERLKGKMTVVSLTPAEEAKWAGIFQQLRQRLGQGTFSPELISRLEQLAK